MTELINKLIISKYLIKKHRAYANIVVNFLVNFLKCLQNNGISLLVCSLGRVELCIIMQVSRSFISLHIP